MLYIFFSIICSVSVSVLLKLAPRFNIDLRQAITGNYWLALILCFTFFEPDLPSLWQQATPTSGLVLLGLGLLLPSLFLVLAQSVKAVGVVRTDAAQRLSLLLPLIAAFILFNEVFSLQKLAGILLGLIAITCIILFKQPSSHRQPVKQYFSGWPLIVFIGTAAIDILFKLMAQLPFISVLTGVFIIAAILSTLYTARLVIKNQAQLAARQCVAGLILGGLNFGNIYFYVRAHQQLATSPALVFSAMNIGVICLATLIGALAFREQLRKINILGLILAVFSVLLLATA